MDRDFPDALRCIHDAIHETYPLLTRIAVAIYDPETDQLRTFSDSNFDDAPIRFYEAKLDTVPSLQEVAEFQEARVVDDLEIFAGSDSLHTTALLKAGYRSSLTAPILRRDELFGFIFFNAAVPDYFTEERVLFYGRARCGPKPPCCDHRLDAA